MMELKGINYKTTTIKKKKKDNISGLTHFL